MKQHLLRLLALCLALAPATAWAHGDHHGLHGVIHVLTEPVHLGMALFVLILAGTAFRWRRRRTVRHEEDDAA